MKLYKCIQRISLIVFSVILVGGILTNRSQIMRIDTLWMISGTLFACAFVIASYLIYIKIIEKKDISKKKEVIFIILISLIFIFILSVIGFCLMSDGTGKNDWDLKIIHDYVYSYANNIEPLHESRNYIKTYSNCNGAIFLLFPIYKIFAIIGIKNKLLPGIIFNIICIYILLLCIYFIIKKLYDTKKALFMFTSSILLISVFLYAPIFYTDTLSMPFIMLQILIYVHNKDKIKKSFIFFPLLAAIGFIVKPTTIFITIAIGLDLIISGKKNIKYLIMCISEFLIIWLIYANLIVSFLFPTNAENKTPFNHFLMMGLYERPKAEYEEGENDHNVYGAFTYEDVIYTNFGTLDKDSVILPYGKYMKEVYGDYYHYTLLTFSNISYKDKMALNFDMIKSRLSEYNVFTYIRFLYNKTIQTWADGSFYVSAKLSRGCIYENILGELFRVHGKYFEVYYYISHFIYMAILFLIVIGGYSDIKKGDNKKIFIKVSLLFLFILLLFWETRSRYILNYVPALYLLAMPGYEKIKEVFYDKKIIKK